MADRVARLRRFLDVIERVVMAVEDLPEAGTGEAWERWPIADIERLEKFASDLGFPAAPIILDQSPILIKLNPPDCDRRGWAMADYTADKGSLVTDRLHAAAIPRTVQFLGRWRTAVEREVAQLEAGLSTATFIRPSAAIAMLRLGTKSRTQKYRVFERLLRKLLPSELSRRGNRTDVDLAAWSQLCARLRRRSLSKADWSDAIADEPDKDPTSTELAQRTQSVRAERIEKKRRGGR